MKLLHLPRPTPCPDCGKPLARVRIEPVLKGKLLEAVAVSCPLCGKRYDLGLETIAYAVALEAVTRLSAEKGWEGT